MAFLIHSILPNPPRPIVYVQADVSLAQCVEIMVQDDIGALVVGDEENVLGILSERDVVRNFVHNGLDAKAALASDILHADVSVLESNEPVEKAMEIFTYTKRRHLLVAENGKIIAILSIGDVLLHLLADKAREVAHLEDYIHSY
jgi:CBS domain-containing protein